MIDPSSELHWLGPEPHGAGRRVYLGMLGELEAGRLVPGQRIVETELATHYAVGRNAVREALQVLATRGVVDFSRNKSPAIRKLDLSEAHEVLDVASAMLGMAAGGAAKAYREEHASDLDAAVSALWAARETVDFSSARRRFYRTLLLIGGNRELQRLFPAIGMHVIHAQYPLQSLREIRQRDYAEIAAAVKGRDARQAEAAAASHVDHVRAAIVASGDAEIRRDHAA